MKRWPILILLAAATATSAGCSSSLSGHARATKAPPSVRQVTWPEAQRLIRACKAKVVGQTHRNLVTLNLWDGSTVRTHEPAIDAVIREVNRLPRKCQPKAFWTE